MKPISTAQEFLKEFNKEKGNIDKLYYDSYIISFAKEFAKLHVEAQAKKIVEKATVHKDHALWHTMNLDNDSILNAYPLTNIK